MMWCDKCKEPVNPQTRPEPDEIGYIFNVAICPHCGQEVLLNADKCVMCGEYTPPDTYLCDLCAEDISSATDAIVRCRGLALESVKDGMAEWINL